MYIIAEATRGLKLEFGQLFTERIQYSTVTYSLDEADITTPVTEPIRIAKKKLQVITMYVLYRCLAGMLKMRLLLTISISMYNSLDNLART